jgi:hypothetical protein
MQFRVVPAVGVDNTTPPQFLQLPAITPSPAFAGALSQAFGPSD